MAQSIKEMLIRLNGEVTSGAQSISDYLTQLGSLLDQIGAKTREFETESVNIYRNYEDEMLAAKYALSAQVESATELERIMDGLDKAAQQWASTSIFHTDDVSKAINEAAHAGWNYQEILEGIPNAMLIAQAGGMDLSSGLDYLIKMMNSTRTPMDQMGTMIDQWAMAANVSATTIDELGQAFISMGSAAQFGDSTAELFTMLAALANVGTTGAKAGTALRSTMMRLIAPTTKAENAMDLLGADVEELEQVLADENVTKAAKQLEGLGFSAFDAQGNLKPIKQIFSELFTLTDGMNEAAKDELLASIFPTRTIATALSLLTASNGELDEIYDRIENSEGYGKKGADIMMSGLTGAIETLKSKWEEFERKIGETLAPQIEKVAGWLGEIVDGLNNMDPAALSGITNMLTALSTIGPILLGAGAIIKMVGALGLWGTIIVAAAGALTYIFGYLEKIAELDFESNFGTLEADIESLGKYVDSVETKFTREQTAMDAWVQKVNEAEAKYENALTKMNEALLTKVLTDQTFTEEDLAQFTKLGNDIVNATLDGIENGEARDLSLLQAMFGKKETKEEIDQFDNLSALLDYSYQELYNEAKEIGENIRAQMVAALQDGSLDENDRAAIQAQIDRLNKIQAEIAAGVQQEAYYAQKEKAGRVSWDTIEAFLAENQEKLNTEYASIDDMYDAFIGRIRYAFERGRKNGKRVTYTDANGVERTVVATQAEEDAAVQTINAQRAQAKLDAIGKYGSISATAIDALMRDSGFSEAWDVLKDYAEGGNLEEALGGRSKEKATEATQQLASLAGYYQKVMKIMEPFADNPEMAAYIKALSSMDQNLAQQANSLMYNTFAWAENQGYGFWTEKGWKQPEGLADLSDQLSVAKDNLQELYAQRDQLEHTYYNAWDFIAGRSYETWSANKETKAGQLEIDIAAAEAQIASLEAQIGAMRTEAELEITVNDKEVQSWDPPEFSTTLSITPSFGGLSSGKGTFTALRAESLGGMFAEGGRATEPSIFGEGGVAEWAIPEEHSERTAALLDATRKASGFTWGELLARFGGLNANPNNSPVVLNYSPTIHAGDASGVAGALAADKDKLVKLVKRALEESRYRDSIEVYA